MNTLGTQSLAAKVIKVVADSTAPSIVSIHYASNGLVDAQTNVMAPGSVALQVKFSEALLAEPYFAMVPNGGVPSSIKLKRSYSDATLYTGNWVISSSMPDGDVHAVVSAYDKVGNRGSDVQQGSVVVIDTHGPEITELLLNPSSPINNDPDQDGLGRSLQVRIQLNDEVKPGTAPQLIPSVNGEPIVDYIDGITLNKDAASTAAEPLYIGTFQLPLSAGKNDLNENASETLSFSYQALGYAE